MAEATLRRRAAGENFPVALRLLPRGLRRDLTALYGFARSVDDIGDEGDAAPAARLAELDAVEADLDRLFAGERPDRSWVADLRPTVAAHDLPRAPFADLVHANRLDQEVAELAGWEQLRDYCRFSADPVGRLVLGVAGAATPGRVARSDEVCTALQVLEHLQDVGEDARRGRVYLPADDRARFGVTRADLLATATGRGLRALVGFEAARARELLASGAALVGGAARCRPGRGRRVRRRRGVATADALVAADFDVLADPVRPSRARTAAVAARLLARPPVGESA